MKKVPFITIILLIVLVFIALVDLMLSYIPLVMFESRLTIYLWTFVALASFFILSIVVGFINYRRKKKQDKETTKSSPFRVGDKVQYTEPNTVKIVKGYRVQKVGSSGLLFLQGPAINEMVVIDQKFVTHETSKHS